MTVKLGDICDLMTGGTPSRSRKEYFQGGKIKWLVSGDIHRGDIYDCEGRITEVGLKNSNARILPTNSVMIALNGQGKTRATVAMLRTEATCNQSLVSIYPKDDSEVLPEWIYWNLKGRYNQLRRLTGDSGNDRRGLNMIIIRNIDLPIPPSISEQQRIVAKLKESYKLIDEAIEATKSNIKNTSLWFDATLKESLESKGSISGVLGDIAEINYGYTAKSHSKGKYRYIRITDISPSGTLNEQGEVYVSEDVSEGYILKKGDLLVARTGATYGKVLYFSSDQPSIYASYLIKIMFKVSMNPKLFWYFAKTKMYWDQANNLMGGAAQPQFNGNALKKLTINYPPDVIVQDEIVRMLDIKFAKAKELTRSYDKKILHLNALKQSILNQAFFIGAVI